MNNKKIERNALEETFFIFIVFFFNFAAGNNYSNSSFF